MKRWKFDPTQPATGDLARARLLHARVVRTWLTALDEIGASLDGSVADRLYPLLTTLRAKLEADQGWLDACTSAASVAFLKVPDRRPTGRRTRLKRRFSPPCSPRPTGSSAARASSAPKAKASTCRMTPRRGRSPIWRLSRRRYASGSAERPGARAVVVQRSPWGIDCRTAWRTRATSRSDVDER